MCVYRGAKFPAALLIFNGAVLGDIAAHPAPERGKSVCVRHTAGPQVHHTQVSHALDFGLFLSWLFIIFLISVATCLMHLSVNSGFLY